MLQATEDITLEEEDLSRWNKFTFNVVYVIEN